MLSVAIMLSGRGSNFKSIKSAIDKGTVRNCKIVAVISDKGDSQGLAFAKSEGLETYFINPKEYNSKAEYDLAVMKVLDMKKVDLVCLAGYMRLLTETFVEKYKNRIINIHPSLLPAFPGLHVQKKALDYGVKYAGCTVHFVDNGTDTGPIILQAVVPVMSDDTEETLSARILEQEHIIYPKAVDLFAAGKLSVDGRKVKIND